MRFLADESCDAAVFRALRTAGHEVLAVAEISPRADDEAVLELARGEQQILLTEDKDFGQLVYADQQATGGVIWPRSFTPFVLTGHPTVPFPPREGHPGDRRCQFP